MMFITEQDIEGMNERFRVNFINSLSGFKSANLIGTANNQGQLNLALFSSVFHVGAMPPLMGMLSRPDSVSRHTLNNIRETGVFTINHVNQNIVTQAHQTSARYDLDQSEFEHAGLTPQFHQGFIAPCVTESHLQILLECREIQEIKINGTVLIIGEIVAVNAPEISVLADGKIDLEQIQSVAVSGLDTYHQTSTIDRLSYAKANKNSSSILEKVS